MKQLVTDYGSPESSADREDVEDMILEIHRVAQKTKGTLPPEK